MLPATFTATERRQRDKADISYQAAASSDSATFVSGSGFRQGQGSRCLTTRRCLRPGSRRAIGRARPLSPRDFEGRRHRQRLGERQIDGAALLPGLVDPTNRILVLRDWMAMVRPTLRTSGARRYPSPEARAHPHQLGRCLDSIDCDAELRGERVTDKNNRAAGEALNRSAVGLGASLVPPSGTGMSVCQENEPCSITA